MAIALAAAAAAVVLALFAAMAVRLLRAQREAYVRTYMFPPGCSTRSRSGVRS